MSPERSLALLPEEDYFPEPIRVTTTELSNFLVGGDYFPVENWDFDTNLDLSEVTPLFHQLYQEKQLIPRYSEDVRKKGAVIYQQIAAEIGEDVENPYEELVEGERSVVLFYDREEDRLASTPLIHGSYGQVELQTATYMSDTYLPYLEMHTHPDDALFSPTDYGNLITQGEDSEQSIVRGIAVACPNIQILALATPHTPLLPYEVSNQFIEEISEEVEQVARQKQEFRHQRIDTIVQAYKNTHEKLLDYIDTILIDEIERRELDGAIPFYYGQILRDELESDYEVEDDTLIERTQTLVNEANSYLITRRQHTLNTMLVDFAREISVDIFTSTDSRHFRKWTA